jgi:hypothetical protein
MTAPLATYKIVGRPTGGHPHLHVDNLPMER